MASVLFQHYARTMLVIANDGIPEDGDEPSFSLQKFMTGTGDPTYQQKYSRDIGGGCKGKHDFCTHCACTSAQHDLLSYLTGDRRCARYVRNQQTICAHCPVNDEKELCRKDIKLLDLLLEDFAKKEECNLTEIS